MQAAQCPINTPITLPQATIPDYLPIALVSTLTGLSPSTIRVGCKKGDFPQPQRFTPKKVFWRKADVLQFLSCKANG